MPSYAADPVRGLIAEPARLKKGRLQFCQPGTELGLCSDRVYARTDTASPAAVPD